LNNGSSVSSGYKPNTLTIEEAKNADAEDDTSTFSPKAQGGRIAKLNPHLSGEARDPRRESNGLGGLIKKVREEV
jgi:hypothetical protein